MAGASSCPRADTSTPLHKRSSGMYPVDERPINERGVPLSGHDREAVGTMAATTLPPHATATPLRQRVYTTLTTARTRVTRTAGAVRQRLRRPALVVGGLGCMDASAWHTYGIGAGLLVLGASLWVFEALTGGDE